MGPGTHIYQRIKNKELPVNRVDAASMIHDIEYLNPFITQKQADETALRNSGGFNITEPLNTLESGLMRLGFATKDIFGYSPSQNYPIYKYLKSQMHLSPYKDIIEKYKLQFTNY